MTGFQLNDFKLSSIILTDSYCVNAFQKEVDYLISFDVDRILAGFRETAGLNTFGKERYPGWENMLIGGHCVGHYISACANALKTPNCSESNRKKLSSILKQILCGLKECQKAIGSGFIFGASFADKNNIEIQFDNVEKNLTNIITQAWVPWYTMHKLIEGILCAIEIDEIAIELINGLVDWIYNRLSKWDEKTRNTVLGIEYGGMNDCLYSCYEKTKNEKALICAKLFDDINLFEKISNADFGSNILLGRHANTTIPKFIGALHRYIVTGENQFFEYAVNFWNLVTNAHTYVNGGNSTWEHFGEDYILYSKLSNCNCETCNSYNMLKLTKLLFMVTGEKKYADWYEHTFINSILSSQNPDTGMTTYFQPMASGYFKVFSSPFNSFWCCTGTGMENFTKLGESYYFENSNGIFINQYISSKLAFEKEGISLIQKSYIPESDFSEFTIKGCYKGNLFFRIPDWADCFEVIINGTNSNYDYVNGYAKVSGSFDDNSSIKVKIGMSIKAYNLPDQEDAWAFKYGPVVLSALLGNHDGKTATNGVNVQVPEELKINSTFIPSKTDVITVKGSSSDDFIKNINQNLVRDINCKDYLKFNLLNTDSNLTYVVHYSQYKQRYGLYFRFLDEKDVKNLMEDNLSQSYINANKLDTVQPGYGQYENDDLHKMTEHGNGSSGQTYRGTSRFAKDGGSFSYRMIVCKKGTNLLFMLDPADKGKSIQIKVDEIIIYDSVVDCDDVKGFKKINIEIPLEAMKYIQQVNYEGKMYDVLTFEICGKNNERSAQLCEFIYTLKNEIC